MLFYYINNNKDIKFCFYVKKIMNSLTINYCNFLTRRKSSFIFLLKSLDPCLNKLLLIFTDNNAMLILDNVDNSLKS